MGPTRTRRWATAAGMLAAVLVGAGCVVPPAGPSVLGLETWYEGPFSVVAPATHYYDGEAGQELNIYAFYGEAGDYTFTAPPAITLTRPGGGTVAPHATVPAFDPWSEGQITYNYELPATGRYRIEVAYPRLTTNVYVYRLYLSLDEDRGTVGLGPLDRPTYGQTLTYHYDGTAGEQLNVHSARIFDPSSAEVPENGRLPDQHTLPVDGSYVVESSGGYPTLSHDIDGGAATLGTTMLPAMIWGQHAVYTYEGTAGEALGVSGAIVFDPTGVRVTSPWSTPRLLLTATGTYSVAATYAPAYTTMTLSHDFEAGPVLAGATGVPGLLPGQSVAFDWPAAGGEQVWVRTTDSVPGVLPHPVVFGPDGTELPGVLVSDGVDQWTSFTAAAAGAHRAVIMPRHHPGTSLVVWFALVPA